MHKRGQFFLIAALVVVGILVGLSIAYTTVRTPREETQIYDLSEEIYYEGAQVIDELKPQDEDIVVKKTTYSAFYETELEKVLKELAPKAVYVAGVCTSICVMDMVGELTNRGYKVVVYKDGIADFDAEGHEFALKRMKNVYGAEIR